MARQQARRRQRERIAGVVVVCVGIVVLVVAVFALREPNGHSSAGSHSSPSSVAKQSPSHSTTPVAPTTKSASSAPKTSETHSGSSVKDVPLIVLNNTTTGGLAGDAAKRFEQGGWTVTSHGNYQNDIISTCAYYDPSVDNAKAAAEALQAQYPTIKRVEPRFDQLPSGPVVVVLTPDYSNT